MNDIPINPDLIDSTKLTVEKVTATTEQWGSWFPQDIEDKVVKFPKYEYYGKSVLEEYLEGKLKPKPMITTELLKSVKAQLKAQTVLNGYKEDPLHQYYMVKMSADLYDKIMSIMWMAQGGTIHPHTDCESCKVDHESNVNQLIMWLLDHKNFQCEADRAVALLKEFKVSKR
jgi:hypothetical protein